MSTEDSQDEDINPKQLKQNHLCYIEKGQNYKQVQNYFLNKPQYKLTGKKINSKPFFNWFKSADINYDLITFGSQLINHIPNISKVFCTEQALCHLIQKHHLKFTKKYKLNKFYPETYRFNVIHDIKNFILSPTLGIWMKKSYSDSILKIFNIEKYRKRLYFQNENEIFHLYSKAGEFFSENLIKSIRTIKIHCNKSIKSRVTNRVCHSNRYDIQEQRSYTNQKVQIINRQSMIQKCIENRLLINNKKFQLSCIVLIVSACPLIVFYHSSYITYQEKYQRKVLKSKRQPVNQRKRSQRRYRSKSPIIKLSHPIQTNKLIPQLKKQPFNREVFHEEAFMKYFNQMKNKTTKKKIAKMFKTIKKILGAVISCGVYQFGHKKDQFKGAFKLLRCNFIITNQFEAKLIKISEKIPTGMVYLDQKTNTQCNYMEKVTNDSLNLMLWMMQDTNNYENIKSTPNDIQPWTLLYNEENNFSYGI